jgi:hypothetical protein
MEAACPAGLAYELWVPLDADQANAAYDLQHALDCRPADPRH